MDNELDRVNSYIKELHEKIATLEKQKQSIIVMVFSSVFPINTDEMSGTSSLKDKNVITPQNNSVAKRLESNPLIGVAFPKNQELGLEQINFSSFPSQSLSPQNLQNMFPPFSHPYHPQFSQYIHNYNPQINIPPQF
jgi:hypothetical protein